MVEKKTTIEVEHIIPTSRRGTDNDSNLALACRACNLHKRDHVNQ